MFDEAGWVVVARAPADTWATEVPADAVFNASFIGTRSVVARRVGAADEPEDDEEDADAEPVDDSVPASTTWTALPEWSSMVVTELDLELPAAGRGEIEVANRAGGTVDVLLNGVFLATVGIEPVAVPLAFRKGAVLKLIAENGA